VLSLKYLGFSPEAPSLRSSVYVWDYFLFTGRGHIGRDKGYKTCAGSISERENL
jgi:hypothetical protein